MIVGIPACQDLNVVSFSLLPQDIRKSVFVYHLALREDIFLARLYYDTDGQDAVSWFEHEMGWYSFFLEFAEKVNSLVIWAFQQDLMEAEKLFIKWKEDWKDFIS